ncbi:MAG: CBS domain-containing protein [Planctomycetota bacterium]|nr:CBS domain-containing protein [Planctomycetota bacterium]
MGHKGGALAENEYSTLFNLLTLSKVSVEKVMTPRTVLFALPKKLTVAEVRKEFGPLRFARIPVYDEDLDEVTGYVTRFEIQKALADDRTTETLEELSRQIPAMLETLPVSRALETMLASHDQIALVVDEYGGVEGIVTLEDLLETLLGREIIDETDIATDMQKLAKEKANQLHGRNAEQASGKASTQTPVDSGE